MLQAAELRFPVSLNRGRGVGGGGGGGISSDYVDPRRGWADGVWPASAGEPRRDTAAASVVAANKDATPS